MSWAVAVPEGKTSFSLTIWSLRREETGQSNVTRVGVHTQVGTHNLPTKRGSEEDTAKGYKRRVRSSSLSSHAKPNDRTQKRQQLHSTP